jgi:hypothetical protein
MDERQITASADSSKMSSVAKLRHISSISALGRCFLSLGVFGALETCQSEAFIVVYPNCSFSISMRILIKLSLLEMNFFVHLVVRLTEGLFETTRWWLSLRDILFFLIRYALLFSCKTAEST